MRRGTSADRVDLLEGTPRDAVPDEYGAHEPEGASVLKTGSSCCRRCAIRSEPVMRHVRSWWKSVVVVLTPVLLLPILLLWKDQSYPNISAAGYIMVLMAVYWITEAIPLVVTSLLPLILLPALGVLTAKLAAVRYLTDTNMLFLGGLMMAVAIEKWDLHRRIALRLLLLVGSRPRWLLLGFMLSSAFLSMWISNTATAAMMLSIAHAVLQELKGRTEVATSFSHSVDSASGGSHLEGVLPSEGSHLEGVLPSGGSHLEGVLPSGGSHLEGVLPSGGSHLATTSETRVAARNGPRGSLVASDGTFDRLCKGLMLGVTYSANIGGIGTLTGTGPNLLLRENAVSLFPDSPGISYGSWFLFGVPMVTLITFCSWLYLSALFCDDSFQWCKWKLIKRPPHNFSGGFTRGVIQRQYNALGPIRWAEVLVLLFQLALIILWVLRDPKVFPGWASLFSTDSKTKESYVSDATIALFVVFLLFVVPSQPCCHPFKRGSASPSPRCSLNGVGSSPKLLDWDTVQRKLPWNVVILLGAGFVLAEASKVSGLTCWLGSKLLGLQSLPPVSIALLITILVAMVTEVLSNTATATLFLPVVASLAVSLQLHPLYLMIPVTVASSFAFMLPIATPPNAIAFSYKYIKVFDMVRTGFLMNIFTILVVTMVLNTIAIPIFDLGVFPKWANQTNNATCVTS
ncbi:hypothetical protein EMCRGX_G023882 [Ephydatia muelleri]